jgi:hypothetical protein
MKKHLGSRENQESTEYIDYPVELADKRDTGEDKYRTHD